MLDLSALVIRAGQIGEQRLFIVDLIALIEEVRRPRAVGIYKLQKGLAYITVPEGGHLKADVLERELGVLFVSVLAVYDRVAGLELSLLPDRRELSRVVCVYARAVVQVLRMTGLSHGDDI